MIKIIDKIEKLRKDNRMSKAKLCREAKINRNTYNGYLKSNNIPYCDVETIVMLFGRKIQFVDINLSE